MGDICVQACKTGAVVCMLVDGCAESCNNIWANSTSVKR